MSKIYSVIIKFLNKEANSDELDALETSLQNTNHIPLFNKLVRIDYLIALCMKKYDLAEAKEAVKVKLQAKQKEKRQNYLKYASIAATVLLVALVAIYKYDNQPPFDAKKYNIVNQIIESGSDRAVLTLADGRKVELEKGKQYQSKKASSNGQELIYVQQTSDTNIKEPSYNYLAVPRGGQFLLKLSDGTKVWLNSESKLKYPANFVFGKNRRVELEYGEAYFEVSPSEQHDGAAFYVGTGGQSVNVLGTKFNIRAIKGETTVITTLAEGSVAIDNGILTERLRPNQQSIVKYGSNEIAVNEVDAAVMTAWVRGLFIFEDEPLQEMMDDLSRWYNIEVFFENTDFRDIPFTGVLERTKSLNQLLETIEASSEGDLEFQINDNNVLLIK